MGKTLAQMVNRVYVDRPQIRGHQDFPWAVVVELLNDGIWFVQKELGGLGMKKWEKTASLSLSVATIAGISAKQATVPTDLLETPNSISSVDCTGATYGGIAEGPGIAYGNIPRIWGNSYEKPTEKQPQMCREANVIYLFPGTIASATVHYQGLLAALSGDSDACGLPTEFQDMAIQQAEVVIDSILKTIPDRKIAEDEIAKAISEQFQKFVSRETTAQRETNTIVELQ